MIFFNVLNVQIFDFLISEILNFLFQSARTKLSKKSSISRNNKFCYKSQEQHEEEESTHPLAFRRKAKMAPKKISVTFK